MRGGQRAASEVDICLHHLAAIKKHFLCQSTVVIVKKGFKAFVHVSSSRSWVTTPNKAVRLCTFSPFYIKQFKYLCRLVKAKIKSFIICIGYSKSNSQYHYYHWSPHPTPCLLWHSLPLILSIIDRSDGTETEPWLSPSCQWLSGSWVSAHRRSRGFPRVTESGLTLAPALSWHRVTPAW